MPLSCLPRLPRRQATITRYREYQNNAATVIKYILSEDSKAYEVQRNAVQRMRRVLQQGIKELRLVSPSASRRSATGVVCILEYGRFDLKKNKKRSRTHIIIVPSPYIAEQFENEIKGLEGVPAWVQKIGIVAKENTRTLQCAMPSVRVIREKRAWWESVEDTDLIICPYGNLPDLTNDEMWAALRKNQFGMVFMDEGHHEPRPALKRFLREATFSFVLFTSASDFRQDQKPLFGMKWMPDTYSKRNFDMMILECEASGYGKRNLDIEEKPRKKMKQKGPLSSKKFATIHGSFFNGVQLNKRSRSGVGITMPVHNKIYSGLKSIPILF